VAVRVVGRDTVPAQVDAVGSVGVDRILPEGVARTAQHSDPGLRVKVNGVAVDGVAAAGDVDTVAAVAERGAGGVGAEVVALDDGAGGTRNVNAGAVVSANNVAGARRDATDGVVGSADINAVVVVQHGGRAEGVGPDEVPLDDGTRAAELHAV